MVAQPLDILRHSHGQLPFAWAKQGSSQVLRY